RRGRVEMRREMRRPLEAAIADADRLRLLAEALRGLLRHLAGADEQHGVALEIAEDALREVDRDARDGDRALAERGLAANALGDAERAAHAAREVAPERA